MVFFFFLDFPDRGIKLITWVFAPQTFAMQLHHLKAARGNIWNSWDIEAMRPWRCWGKSLEKLGDFVFLCVFCLTSNVTRWCICVLFFVRIFFWNIIYLVLKIGSFFFGSLVGGAPDTFGGEAWSALEDRPDFFFGWVRLVFNGFTQRLYCKKSGKEAGEWKSTVPSEKKSIVH